MKKAFGIAILLLALVVAGVSYFWGDFGFVAWASSWLAWGLHSPVAQRAQTWISSVAPWSAAAEAQVLEASGFIEARQVSVVPEVSGRILTLVVEEGDAVVEGDVLVQLDTSVLDAQIAEAEAAVAVAEAQLALVRAGASETDVAVAEAAVALAEARRDGAYRTWQSAIQVRDNPQELDLQIAAARSQLAVLEHRVAQATAIKDAAELMNGLAERQVQTVESGVTVTVGPTVTHVDIDKETRQRAWANWNLATTDVWTAWTNLEGIQAARDSAAATLAQLEQMRANPQEAALAVAQAEATYRQAEAAVAVAQSQLDLLRSGASAEQIAVAEAAVAQARRNLDALLVQRGKSTIVAPMSGFIAERNASPGEIAVAGRALLVIGSLDTVELRAYVPEPQLGQVFVGQSVSITVDSFPGEVFAAEVIQISDKAEYTPRNVSTQEERAETVYAVLIRADNADHRLKPGMPADAAFSEQ